MSIDITNHLIPYKQVKQMLATAWDEGYEAGSNDVELHLNALNGHTDYDEYEDTPNPYRDR